jgi:exopolysaccharide biosynthesis polyprenyl glycosylphosphotransferase
MATTEQACDSARRIFGLKEAEHTQPLPAHPKAKAAKEERSEGLPRLTLVSAHEWSVALFTLCLDVVAWVSIYGVSSFLRHEAFYETPFQFFVIDLIQLIVIVQALYIIGGYDRNVETRSLTYTTEHILAIGAAAAFSAMLIYSAATFDQTMKPSRGVLLVSFIVFVPVSLGYRRWIRHFVAATTANKAFLVVGSGDVAKSFYQAYQNTPKGQQLHFVDVDSERVGLPIAGPGSPIIEGDLARKLGSVEQAYSGIILAESVDRLSPELLDRLIRTQFQRTRVYTLESFYESHWRYVPLAAIDPMWPLQTGFQLARISPYHYLKRLFDLVTSAVALTVCAPLFGLIAIAIWLEARFGRPGGQSLPAYMSVLFRQERVGWEGKPFTVLKFRTMHVRSDEENEDIYTRKGDPRITHVGRWLRKFRLDELPQLWNVFSGEMSLIGPRAEWTKCAERYEKKIPFYHFRHLVKPGITGWAQVNYPYGESDEDAIEKLKYDLYYIRHYSLKLDAMIVLKTVHVMLFSKGQ